MKTRKNRTTGTFEALMPTPRDGRYSIQIEVIDAAGNTGPKLVTAIWK
ncbi:MAG: hypothetical protein V4733_04440 [Verrucomicrobiota bacterium]